MKEKKLLTLDEYREKLFETARFIMATTMQDMHHVTSKAQDSITAARELVNLFYTTYE